MGRLATLENRHGAAIAATVGARLETRNALDGLLIGLQCVGRAAIVLDDEGKVVGMNALGRHYVGPLAPSGSRHLAAGSAVGSRRIRDLVDAALQADGGRRDVAAIVDIPDRGRVIVRATDVRAAAPSVFGEPRVLLDIAGLGLDSLPTPAFLRRVLGLTAAEADVALALAGGATASAIARKRAVSLATVRSHLKTIFAKTGTRRQASLVAIVLQLRGAASG